MSKFGKYAVLEPIQYHFKEEPTLWWMIRPPTTGDELSMAKFLNRGKVVWSVEGAARDAAPTWLEIAHREIAIAFAGTNIPATDTPVEQGGKPLIATTLDIPEIEVLIREMPHAMIMEIWRAMGEAIPGWGGGLNPNPPSRENEIPAS